MSSKSEQDPTAAQKTRGFRDGATLAADLSMSGHALQAGTQLHDYVITGLLGEGGFGIVYLAEDPALERQVAIKEYLPASMASRAKNAQTVLVKSRNHEETFAAGLKSFVNEARLLARFDHPALVKVHRFWEEHGTAYMVMPYYRGPTLKSVLASMGHLPDAAELGLWLWPLMDALAVMHAAQCYHRDIAPDNILITDSGPLLLDFGAARRVIGDMTHALTVVLKPGFAPIEQYGDLPGMTQGPWTDIYALASVLYAAITGKKPMPSVERLMDDRLRPLAEVAAGRFPAPFLQAIDLALALKPADRPQSVEAFRALLLRPDEAGVVVQALPLAQPAPAAVQPAKTVKLAKKPAAAPEPAGDGVAPQKAARTGLLLALGAAAVVAAGVGVYALTRGQKAEPASASPPALVAPTVSAPTLTPPAVTPSVVTAPLASPPVASAPAQRPAEPVQQAQPASVPLQEPAAEGPVAPPVAPLKEPAKPIPKAPVKEAPRQESAKPAAAAPAVTKGTDVRAKCSDILQKASLEPLSSSEQAFLRKECR